MKNKLFIVGIGPGESTLMAPRAVQAIESSEVVVGYQLYLDLVADLTAGKEILERPLGEETERVQAALVSTASGRDTALISSGDVGIYALATLVFEQMEAREAWRDLDVEVVPGISAMQVAAARAGAPLGHDFCAISLSDLLTPWEVIQKRVDAAAAGDFVVAFYNPVSRRRDWQLRDALDRLLAQRGGGVPVILARQLGRDEEQVRVVPLGELDVTEVDMLTVVVVGNSETRQFQGAGIGPWVYTPRGYAGKSL